MTNRVEINNHPEKQNPLTGILWSHYLQAFTNRVDAALILSRNEVEEEARKQNNPRTPEEKDNYAENQMVLRDSLIRNYKDALSARISHDQFTFDNAYKTIKATLTTYSQTDSLNAEYENDILARADLGLRGINPQWEFKSPRLSNLNDIPEPPSFARINLTVRDSTPFERPIGLDKINLTGKPNTENVERKTVARKAKTTS